MSLSISAGLTSRPYGEAISGNIRFDRDAIIGPHLET